MTIFVKSLIFVMIYCKKLLLTMTFFIALSFIMCTQGPSAGINNQQFNPGQVANNVKCLDDSTLSYALYLPSNYDKEKTWPVLICFDPHAEGLIPVNLFFKQAEKSGFIVAGSNSSQNGMSAEQTNNICDKLIKDLKYRFHIDDKSIYLGGFSGGSRIAGSYAITSGNIAGVVGIGAGLNANTRQFPAHFSYLAIAGTFDFNYSEMYYLDKSLDKSGIIHHFIEFDGPHAWPPEYLVPDIFTWLAFDRMRQSIQAPNRNQINSFIEEKYSIYEDFKEKRKYFEAYYTLVLLKHYLNSLNDLTSIEEEITKLLSLNEVQNSLMLRESVFKMESQLQSTYSQQLQQESFGFWKQKIAEINAASEAKPVDDHVRMQKRLLGFLSISAYSISNHWLRQNNQSESQRYIELYRTIDPGNSEHRYMAAQLDMKMNKKTEALAELKNAFDLGFNDKNRIMKDPLFATLQSDPAFLQLLK